MSLSSSPRRIAKFTSFMSLVVLSTVCIQTRLLQGNEISVIAIEGTPSPIPGEIFSLTIQAPPSLNNTGMLAFRSDIIANGSSRSRIFRGNESGVELIARQGDLFDGETKAVLSAGYGIAINSAGEMATNLTWNPPANSNIRRDAIVLFDNGDIIPTAFDGSPEPNGGGFIFFRPYYLPALNTSGQLAFTTSLVSTSDGAETALYRSEPNTGALTELVREGDTVPGGNGVFIGHADFSNAVFPSPVLNDSGEVAFVGMISGSGVSNDQGIYRADGLTIEQVVRANDQTPDFLNTSRRFREFKFWRPSINDSGDIAFAARLTGGVQIEGIYKSVDGVTTRIAEIGFGFEGLDGFFRRKLDGVEINNSGDVVFHAGVILSDGNGFQSGIFLQGSEASDTRIIALGGLPAPGGLGEFYKSGSSTLTANYSLNDSGQVAFLTLVDTLPNASGGVIEALFLDNPGGEVEVVAYEGMSFEGSIFTELSFAGTSSLGNDWTDEYQGLNNRGEVAFAFELADGREGMALWSSETLLEGDFDADGDVAGADFLAWQRGFGSVYNASDLSTWETNYGANESELDGGFDSDGDVDGADFLKWQRDDGTSASLALWKDNFGTPSNSGLAAASTTIPEPSTLLLTALGLVSIGYRRHRGWPRQPSP